MPPDAAERRVLAVAAGQHGAVSLAQVLASGLGRHRVARLVRSGWMRRLHYGVYLVGPLETPLTHAMAAVLAYSPKGLLSHYSAAVLRRLRPPPLRGIHVTVVTESGVHSRNGVHAHRCGSLDPADITHHEGVPVTSPARTLLDLATQVTARDLARAVEEAQVLHLVTNHKPFSQ
jgi:predicted transcriptional regulator of viral defense system